MTKQAEGFCYGIIICFVLFMLFSILPGSLGMISSFQLGNNSFDSELASAEESSVSGEGGETFAAEETKALEVETVAAADEERITYAWEMSRD